MLSNAENLGVGSLSDIASHLQKTLQKYKNMVLNEGIEGNGKD